jgi:uncharacterized protein DUF11
MPKAGFIVARISFLVITASMLGVAMLAAPAVGQTSTCTSTTKCFFAVSVSPSTPAAGATNTDFKFTIQNEASPQQLGSVQISAPAGFTITNASCGPGCFTSSSALFLNLNLASGAQTTLTVTTTVPCGSGSYQWGIAAKQSNDFNGTGNDFQLDPRSAGNLSGTFTGSTGSCTSQPCPPNTSCSSASSGTTSGTATTSAPLPPGDSLMTEMESVNSSFNYQCPSYTAVADVFGFAVFDNTGAPQSIPLTVTMRIFKSQVQSSGHTGASSWQICYASTIRFNAVPDTSQQNVTIGGSPGYFTGLLLNCSSSQGAPCVQSRNKNNAGDVIVTFLASGDPFGHP